MLDVKKDFRLLIDYSVLKKFNKDNINKITKSEKNYQQVEDRKEFDIWAFGNFLNQLFSGGDKLWVQIGQETSNTKTISLLYEQYPYSVSNKIKNTNIKQIIETCARVKTGQSFSIRDIMIKLYKEFFVIIKSVGNFSALFGHYTEKEKLYLLNKVRSYLVLCKFYLNLEHNKLKDFNFLTVFLIRQDKNTRIMTRTLNKSMKLTIE